MVLSQFLVNPLVAVYARWLGAGTTLIGALTGLYFAVSFLMRPVSGPTIAVVDHRKLLIMTYLIGVVVNFMYAAFPSIPMFLLARVLHGVEFAFLGSLLMVMAGDSLPPEQLGPGLGMFALGTSFGMAFGPSLGVALRTWGTRVFGGEGGGYRMAFIAATLSMLLALIPCFLVKEAPRGTEGKSTGKWYSNIFALPAVLPAVMLVLINMCNNLYTSYLVPYGDENGFSGIALFFTLTSPPSAYASITIAVAIMLRIFLPAPREPIPRMLLSLELTSAMCPQTRLLSGLSTIMASAPTME